MALCLCEFVNVAFVCKVLPNNRRLTCCCAWMIEKLESDKWEWFSQLLVWFWHFTMAMLLYRESDYMLCILYFDKGGELKHSLSLSSICIHITHTHTRTHIAEMSVVSACTSASYSTFNALEVKSVLMLEKCINTLIPTWGRFLARCVWQARRHVF